MRDTTKKTVVLEVSGGIAAFKVIQLTSNLIKKGYDVEAIMTQNATELTTPLISESLTKHNVMASAFEKVADHSVKHISIAHHADIFVFVPATANVIAKIVHGPVDDMLTTTFLAADCPKAICPAMNTSIYENLVTQKNLEAAKTFGYELVKPEAGYLAHGDTRKGKLVDITHIEERICCILETTGSLRGKCVLAIAGPTRETLDPVRFISNHSSGKMGYEIAGAARDMGTYVTLINGPVQLNVPYGVHVVQVVNVQDMFEAAQQEHVDCNIIIKIAAVGDYRAQKTGENEIKKQGEFLEVTLVRNPDILAWLGEYRISNQIICGFVMETEYLLEYAAEKPNRKNCDMIVVNNLHEQEAGFQGNTNMVTLLQKNHTETLDPMNKYEVGAKIPIRLATLSKEKEEA